MYMFHRESRSSHYESYKVGFYQGEDRIFLVTILPLAQSRSSKINNIAAADRVSRLQFPQAIRLAGISTVHWINSAWKTSEPTSCILSLRSTPGRTSIR